MKAAEIGPISDRNIACMTLLLRSTLIKRPEFKKLVTKTLEKHFLDLFNEPTIHRVRGFFKEESLAHLLWSIHIMKGRLEGSIETFLAKNPKCTVNKALIY
jgi:hypothetical protein